MRIGEIVVFTQSHTDYLVSIGRWPLKPRSHNSCIRMVPQKRTSTDMVGVVQEVDIVGKTAVVDWGKANLAHQQRKQRHFIDNLDLLTHSLSALTESDITF